MRRSKVFTIMLIVFAISSLLTFQLSSYPSPPYGLTQAHSPMGFHSQQTQLARRYQTYTYDEQVGETFTGYSTSLAFNVTAVVQMGPDGAGPAYLLNGLTDAGYWYQVGLSWNWPDSTGGYNAGFSMNYEVFDPYGNSVFPYSGGGGIQSIIVNGGDTVLLSLNFTAGNVLMQAYDFNSGSTASQTYSAAYASHFIGLTGSNEQNGFFTGLMTEQYHSQPYFGPGQPVTYTSSGVNMSSAWMWMDEFNAAAGGQSVFRAETTSPVRLENSTVFQYFSSNGTAEVANPNELMTGLSPVKPILINSTSLQVAQAGEQAPLTVKIQNPSLLNAKITEVKVSTSLGSYNTSTTLPFAVNTGSANFTARIAVPAALPRGNYTLTIFVSWQFLDPQIDHWVTQGDLTTSAILRVSKSGGSTSPPSSNPGTNPPPTGSTTPSSKGQPKSQNATSGLLTRLGGVLILAAFGFIALVTLAVVLVVREETRRKLQPAAPSMQFCIACGGQTGAAMLFCPNCGHPTMAPTQQQNSTPGENPPTERQQSTA